MTTDMTAPLLYVASRVRDQVAGGDGNRPKKFPGGESRSAGRELRERGGTPGKS
jgi:hypothetical protein